MKKRFFAFLKIFILSVFCLCSLSACSCTEPQAIVFNENFIKGFGSSLPTEFKEELIYTVKYKDDMYGYNISNAISSSDFSFKEGSYKTTLTRLSVVPDEIKDNEIYKGLSSTDKIYSFKTSFSIPVTYFGGTENAKDYTDTIESVVYFCSQGMSFAPIYSHTKASYTLFSVYGDEKFVEPVSYESSIVYGKTTYAITLSTNGSENKTSQIKYDFKCLVDNAQLLFVLRNFEVTANEPKGLNVVSPNYEEYTNLGVYYSETHTEETENLLLNGKEVSEKIKLDKLYYKVNAAKNSGKEHYVYITNQENNGTIPNNAYVYKYVQPLIAYGNFEVMGSLEFLLVSITH